MIPRMESVSRKEFLSVVTDSPEKVVCIDCETTGLNPEKDGILSLSIVDGNLDVLFHSLLHTYRKRSWREAQRINGISPRMVRDSPSIPQVREQVMDIISNAEIVTGYNIAPFDIPMMANNGFWFPRTLRIFDVYPEFVMETRGEGKHRLIDCARMYDVGFEPHDSLEDSKAAMLCAMRIVGGGSE